MKSSLSIGAILVLASFGGIANAQPISVPQSAPYSMSLNKNSNISVPDEISDSDTVLLEHFDGQTSGTLHGTAQRTQGVFGQGIHLNDSAFVSWNLGALPEGTVEFWFKLDNFKNHKDPKDGLVLLSAGYGLPQALTMQVTANYRMKPTIIVGVNRNAGDWTGLDGIQTVTAGVWYHVAVTWGQSGKKIYLTGNLLNSDSTPSVLNPATGVWAIGAEIRNGNDGFNGTIDELRISSVQRQFTADKPAVVSPVATTATAISNAPDVAAYSPKHFDVQIPADLKTPQAVSQAMADAKQELASINAELDKASQEHTDLETKLASGKKKITALQSRQDKLKQESAELDGKIKTLQSQEVYVFQSAGAILDAQDFSGALQAYKDFVSKFPQTARVSKANEIIASLEQKLGVNKQ